MTEENTPGLADYILYRLEKSEEAYTDACLLSENKSWNAAVNR